MVRQPQELMGIWIGGAAALLSTQPVWAAATPVTAVRLNPSESSLEVILETVAEETQSAESAKRPQVFTVSHGNDVMADLVNTQLRLNKDKSFRQDNPMPGIASVVVAQLDDNRIRVTVSGDNSAPKGQIIKGEGKAISLSFSPQVENQADQGSKVELGTEKSPVIAQIPTTQSSPTTNPFAPGSTPQTLPANSQALPSTSQTPIAPTPTTQPTPVLPTPDVLVPNPEIKIQGNSAPAAGVVQPIAPAPPFLPRAVAPPVGDISVSNVDSSPTAIDLGTATRVPRLVLREAPVREVLALLARSAGLNLAFTGAAGAATPGAPGTPAGTAGAGGPTISLDIENEPVQDVFNYVLQLSGLQANRVGRTIFVGTALPQGASNIVTRSFRLNQVNASAASGFLSAQGAETQRVVEQVQIQTVGEGASSRTVEIRSTSIQPLAATVGTGPLLLRGLSVLTDERLNAVTMVGDPRKVQIATSLLTQLDARRRQVAVNVKIVDINLLNTDQFNTSFSFGVGKSFLTVDSGAAVFNYGGVRPPTAGQAAASTISPTVITNPFAGANVFLDPNSSVTIPGTLPGSTIVNSITGTVTRGSQQPGTFYTPFVRLDDPLAPGFTTITPATNDITTIATNGTSTTAPGTNGTVTSALPALFQFPTRFLSLLQAQITSGNAKILTDPTLVVQEGETARVNLTQEVFGGFQLTTQTTGTTNITSQVQQPIIKQAGLILQIAVSRIDDNGFVTLGIQPTVSAPAASTSTPQGIITLVQSRELQSGQIRLRDGQTLIMSGIIQESDRTTVSKVPILGDIPILGALFRSTNRQNQRNEVIVLVTPQILDDSSRSAFGYNYTPGADARQVLQRGNR
jgi:type IV pilus assembly protein PilQ